jgi:hypothetical protein
MDEVLRVHNSLLLCPVINQLAELCLGSMECESLGVGVTAQ